MAHVGTQKNAKPLYAFGHGLSYTRFAYGDLKVSGGETILLSFTVTNTGKRAGARCAPALSYRCGRWEAHATPGLRARRA
jgi:hypothetical protein